MRGRRIDGNQRTIDALARRVGAVVICASAAPEIGFDRLYIRGEQTYIVEVKDPSKPPSKRQLTEGEQKTRQMIEDAGGKYWIIETDDDLLRMFGLR